MSNPIKSICLVRLSALGDVVMYVPLVRTLQAQFPDAQLTWVISRPAYDLVEGMPGINFVVINKPKNLRDYWRFRQRMKNTHFDVLLATQASLRANLLYPLINASRKIGYDNHRAKDGHRWFVHETIEPGHDHVVDGFLRFADALGVSEKTIKWDLPIRPSDVTWAKAHLPLNSKPVLLVNPAASKPERNWLPERYIDVIRYAKKQWDAHIILIGGPSANDKALGDAIVAAIQVVNLIGQTKPKQLLALIRAADILLCPDTGPSHMSTAVGTPVVALHAVTSVEISGPYLYQDLSVNCYNLAVERILNKASSEVPWGTRAHGPETMKLVSVDNVIQKLNQAFLRIESREAVVC